MKKLSLIRLLGTPMMLLLCLISVETVLSQESYIRLIPKRIPTSLIQNSSLFSSDSLYVFEYDISNAIILLNGKYEFYKWKYHQQVAKNEKQQHIIDEQNLTESIRSSQVSILKSDNNELRSDYNDLNTKYIRLKKVWPKVTGIAAVTGLIVGIVVAK